MEVKVISKSKLAVPSASGIVKHKDAYYIIGDNTPWIFKLNEQMDVVGKTLIADSVFIEDSIIQKSEKPDFEGLELVNENEILLFGSGSKTPEREHVIRYNLENKSIEKYHLTEFYAGLRAHDILKDSELNIEALACFRNRLYILNRRKNVIFEYTLTDFLDYLGKRIEFPVPKIYEVMLPSSNGIDAGLSGATMFTETKMLITASLEATDNAYDDGEILGSYVGVIDLSNENNGVVLSNCALIQKEGETLPIKVESVTIDKIYSDAIELILVTDNDGGDSEILKAQVALD
jgi:hypothetical protein